MSWKGQKLPRGLNLNLWRGDGFFINDVYAPNPFHHHVPLPHSESTPSSIRALEGCEQAVHLAAKSSSIDESILWGADTHLEFLGGAIREVPCDDPITFSSSVWDGVRVPQRKDDEQTTRREGVERALREAGWWPIVDFVKGKKYDTAAVREYETSERPRDYLLFHNGETLAAVEAKKLTVGPQNVLT